MKMRPFALVLAAASVLSACGGGGGTVAPTSPPPSPAPSASSPSAEPSDEPSSEPPSVEPTSEAPSLEPTSTVDATSAEVASASLLDEIPGFETIPEIEVVDDYENPAFQSHSGLRWVRRQWSTDAESGPSSVFDLRYQFPTTEDAEAWLVEVLGPENDLAETNFCNELQQGTPQVGADFGHYFFQGDCIGFGIEITQHVFIFRVENIVVKLYTSGDAFTLDDVYPLAERAFAEVELALAGDFTATELPTEEPSGEETPTGVVTADPATVTPTADFLSDFITRDEVTYSGENEIVNDDTSVITVSVPKEWSERQTGTAQNGQPGVFAGSGTYEEFEASWNVSAMQIGFDPERTSADIEATFIERSPGSQCTDSGRFDYDDSVYTGEWQLWTACGDTETMYVQILSTPSSDAFLILVEIQVAQVADLAVVEEIVRTFQVSAASG